MEATAVSGLVQLFYRGHKTPSSHPNVTVFRQFLILINLKLTNKND